MCPINSTVEDKKKKRFEKLFFSRDLIKKIEKKMFPEIDGGVW